VSQTSQNVQAQTVEKVAVDMLTTMSIAAIAFCLTAAIHEGVHALSCIGVGANLQEFSAMHVACETNAIWQRKIVAGSAAIINIVIGFICLLILQRSQGRASETQFFLWVFMLMNWLLGAGYWMFSGIANVGDWATVIDGLEPHWLWRIVMAAVGSGVYLFFVWFSLRELGKIIGGTDAQEQITRATKLGMYAYIVIFLVTLATALFNPYGITGLPAVAGLLLALGGMSPLLWMMQWFRAKSFVKIEQAPLAIDRRWSWVMIAAVVVLIDVLILGRTIYF
jgi:hypothetical protein